MKRVILVGSPRTHGRSAQLADQLFEALIEECPQDELYLIPVSEIDVAPCVYCNGCQDTCTVIERGEDGSEISSMKHRCVFDDDMQGIYDILDEADELIVACPVFFSGAPAAFKGLLDRLQPYYWTQARLGEKRPATLHVIGEGGDPHGYGALVSEVRSALAVAGFKLVRVLDWVGKIDAKGEIVAEAEEHLLDESTLFANGGNVLPHTQGEVASTWSVAEGAQGKTALTARPKLKLNNNSLKDTDAANATRSHASTPTHASKKVHTKPNAKPTPKATQKSKKSKKATAFQQGATRG